MKTLRCLIIVLLVGCSLQGLSLDLTRINLSYQYNLNAAFFAQYKAVKAEDGVSIFMDVRSDSLSRWSIYYLNQESYSSTQHDTLTNLNIDTLLIKSNRGYYQLKINNPPKPLLLVCFADLSTGNYRILDLKVKSLVGFPSVLPLGEEGLPLLNNFITREQIEINSDEQLHAFQYEDDFGASDPPMGMMKPIAPSLTIDSSFYFQRQLSNLEDYHFYLVQTDTLAENGLTLIKCPSYFPEYKRLDELIGPLTYITTPSELKDLKGKMTKRAFETFWISTYGTKFRAKSAIRYYYNQVEEANLLFTDYKQGWKTDRGMIYIVYGKPDKVMRNERSEVWYYRDGTEFEFIRISTLFTPSMYSLKRDRKYEKDWYTRVGDLRKG